ncbi:MAG: DUF805 domain-containing protein [Alloalcanivorax venustensis]|uniref:DUF805 domain-containing protein n=1 Tax=Alloalcanivorax venustensis TaxID=172371 RepID=UPI0032990E2A
MNQPYEAPSSALGAGSDSRYQPRLFQVKGRLGRMRYFVYAMTITLIVYAVFAAVTAFAAVAGQSATEPGGVMFPVLMIVLAVGGLFTAVMSIIYGVRRLNDLNMSGWLILLMLVPLANFVMALVLLFVPGSKADNKYGPAPTANGGGVIAALVIMLLVMVGWFGILGAVTIPAYQDYVERAQMHQMQR